MIRRALCIGIDNYGGSSLRGCVSDAERLGDILRRNEDKSPNFDVRLLTAPIGGGNNLVTRATVRVALDDLFNHPADMAFLSFSGHGSENNLGGYLITQDAQQYDDGIPLSEIIEKANQSRVTEIVILIDSCHSGHLGNIPASDNSRAQLKEGLSILTASRGGQVSVEDAGGGVFTSLVVDALDGGAADILGDVSAPSIYSYVEAALGAWQQRPLFKSHVAQLIPIRKCHPAIDVDIIRNLPSIFPLPAEDFSLTPTFENSHLSHNTHNVGVFSQLQALNRVHLVVPVGCSHMYDAAMESRSCRLTPSGRYYWRLAQSGRI